ncbi:MAG: hypothetical protein R6U04_03545 [Bacteroidales bacterium]
MKRLIIKTAILVSLSFVFLWTGCNVDEFDLNNLSDDTEINQEWATPLIKGELDMEDLLENIDSSSIINTEESGLLYLVFTDTLLSHTAADSVKLPGQEYFDILFSVPGTINSFDDTIEATIDTLHPVTFKNDEQLDSIITDMFSLRQIISSDIQHDINIVITYTDVRKDGEPLVREIYIPAEDAPYYNEEIENLTDYTIQTYDTILESDPDTTKYFRMKYELTINGTGNNDLNENEEISIQNNLEEIDMQSAYGYIGQTDLMAQEGNIPVGIFEGSDDAGTVEFKEPEFKFYITNSYGVPVQIKLKDAKAYRKGSLDSTDITFDNNTSISFDINYPQFSENEIGEEKKDTINFNNENCNLSEALAENPTHIKFTSEGISNPEGPEGPYNFVTDDSQFRMNSELYLPLHLRADGFSLKDTLELDMSEILGEDNEIIKEVITKFKTQNGLPTDVNFQVYFLDDNYNMIDTLFNADDRPVIESASTNDEGEVTSLTEKIAEMNFHENRIEDLKNVRNAVFEGSLKTSDFNVDTTKKVKFYSHYTFKFRMSIETKVKFE